MNWKLTKSIRSCETQLYNSRTKRNQVDSTKQFNEHSKHDS